MASESERLDALAKRNTLLYDICYRNSVRDQLRWCYTRLAASLYAAHSWPVMGERLIAEAEATYHRISEHIFAVEFADLGKCIESETWGRKEQVERVHALHELGFLDDDQAQRQLDLISEHIDSDKLKWRANEWSEDEEYDDVEMCESCGVEPAEDFESECRHCLEEPEDWGDKHAVDDL